MGATTGWLAASLLAGTTYWAVPLFGLALPLPLAIAWKGAGVLLLAAFALRSAADADRPDIARWIAAVMVLGALGDMVLEVSQTGGAAFFLAGHWLAAALYWRERDRNAGRLWLVAAGLAVAVPLWGSQLPGDPTQTLTVGLYATGLGVMAALALVSRFPRGLVAMGALLFVASDLLIFARMGPLADSLVPRLLVWPLYFAGQFLIAVGVIGTVRAQREFANQ